jgi:hypothetical protein
VRPCDARTSDVGNTIQSTCQPAGLATLPSGRLPALPRRSTGRPAPEHKVCVGAGTHVNKTAHQSSSPPPAFSAASGPRGGSGASKPSMARKEAAPTDGDGADTGLGDLAGAAAMGCQRAACRDRRTASAAAAGAGAGRRSDPQSAARDPPGHAAADPPPSTVAVAAPAEASQLRGGDPPARAAVEAAAAARRSASLSLRRSRARYALSTAAGASTRRCDHTVGGDGAPRPSSGEARGKVASLVPPSHSLSPSEQVALGAAERASWSAHLRLRRSLARSAFSR